MGKNYGVTVVSSLVQTIACGLPFWFGFGLGGFLGVGLLTFASVWFLFFYLYIMLQQNMPPSVKITMGFGAILFGMIAVCFCCAWLPTLNNEWGIGIAGLFGAIVGLLMGYINFRIWSHRGFILGDYDDVLDRRSPKNAPVVEQEGVWPPSPRIPDRDVPRP